MALDPRSKLILSLEAAAAVTAAGSLAQLIAAWAFMLAVILLRQRFKPYCRWLLLVAPMAVFFGLVTWWSVDAMSGYVAGMKLLLLTNVFFIFFMSVMPEDLANALVSSGFPYPAAFVLSTAMQYVPVLGRKAAGVLDAQRARGIPLEPGWSALKHYPAFLVPLLLQSFQLAEELAEAMEARGFGRPGRTFLHDFRLRWSDWLAMAAGAAALGIFLSSYR